MALSKSIWISLRISSVLCFITPPHSILDSTVLSEWTEDELNENVFNSEIWHQPRFNKSFSSFWYFWQTTPGQLTNEHIVYGLVEWIFNGSHMFYHYSIPSSHIDYHQFVTNDTLYLWQEDNEQNNRSQIECYSYNFGFDIISNYFANSSFCGLTDSPDIFEGICSKK